MTKTIAFLGKDYTQAALAAMTDESLLELRNLVASNLGVASIRGFKDHDHAVEQTWKALEKFESTAASEAGEAGPAEEKPKKAKAPKEPKERKLAKSSGASLVKRPTRKMFATIKKTGEHDGTQGRQHRWPNYKDGMTIVDVIETEGTEPWDVYNWQSKGIMTVVEATDEEYAERRAAWYAKHGLTDPDLSKEQKAKEKADAKAKREADMAAKKAEREAAAKAKADAKAAAAAAPAEA
jgi:colicin import membrane protein